MPLQQTFFRHPFPPAPNQPDQILNRSSTVEVFVGFSLIYACTTRLAAVWLLQFPMPAIAIKMYTILDYTFTCVDIERKTKHH